MKRCSNKSSLRSQKCPPKNGAMDELRLLQCFIRLQYVYFIVII